MRQDNILQKMRSLFYMNNDRIFDSSQSLFKDSIRNNEQHKQGYHGLKWHYFGYKNISHHIQF